MKLVPNSISPVRYSPKFADGRGNEAVFLDLHWSTAERAEEGGRLMADAGFPLAFVGVCEMRGDVPMLRAVHPTFGDVYIVGGTVSELVEGALRARGASAARCGTASLGCRWTATNWRGCAGYSTHRRARLRTTRRRRARG